MARGGNRPGAGRKAGVPNKASQKRQKDVAASGLTPLDYMLSVLRDTKADKDKRMDAAKAAAPYVHPRLATATLQGPRGGPIQTVDLTKLSDDELARLEDILGPVAVAGGDQGGEGEEGGGS